MPAITLRMSKIPTPDLALLELVFGDAFDSSPGTEFRLISCLEIWGLARRVDSDMPFTHERISNVAIVGHSSWVTAYVTCSRVGCCKKSRAGAPRCRG